MKSVGFKEWAAVCEALGCGRQSVIVRKGGIAEGREGFSFTHQDFFLFPTWFHEQPQKVRQVGVGMLAEDCQIITIKYAATVDLWRTITSWEVAAALAPLHILQPAVVRERFDYDKLPGLHVAFVRVFRLTPTWSLPNEMRYGGCRSWVNLPEAPNGVQLMSVLSEAEHGRLRRKFLTIVSEITAV